MTDGFCDFFNSDASKRKPQLTNARHELPTQLRNASSTGVEGLEDIVLSRPREIPSPSNKKWTEIRV